MMPTKVVMTKGTTVTGPKARLGVKPGTAEFELEDPVERSQPQHPGSRPEPNRRRHCEVNHLRSERKP